MTAAGHGHQFAHSLERVVSFGLVHIPVSLHIDTTDHSIDFDWLDRRSMDPVGYKRMNKKRAQPLGLVAPAHRNVPDDSRLEPRPSDRHRCRSARRSSMRLRNSGGEGTDAQLRSLQVEQHADRAADIRLDRADQLQPLLVVGVRAVAEVQAEDISAGAHQRLDGGAVRARGAERGDDLGVAGWPGSGSCGGAIDDDGPEVVDVGQGRAGQHRVAQRLEEATPDAKEPVAVFWVDDRSTLEPDLRQGRRANQSWRLRSFARVDQRPRQVRGRRAASGSCELALPTRSAPSAGPSQRPRYGSQPTPGNQGLKRAPVRVVAFVRCDGAA